MKILFVNVLLVALVVVIGGRGSHHDASGPSAAIPAWAKVAPEQIAEAKKHGVPVAFENDLGMRFVLIPAGVFRMGPPLSESEHEYPHLRLHQQVRLREPYYIQITEVSNGQFRAFQEEHDSGRLGGTSLDGDEQPVVNVSWGSATAYAKWATAMGGGFHAYRLPRSSEWERAGRADTNTRYFWGDSLEAAARYANLQGRECDGGMPATRCFPAADGYTGPAPVASFEPNRWGLYDMVGNVLEWCRDEAPSKGLARRVVRGGWFGTSRDENPLSSPGGVRPERRAWYVGFRLVSPLPEATR